MIKLLAYVPAEEPGPVTADDPGERSGPLVLFCARGAEWVPARGRDIGVAPIGAEP
jgi:hypothetical protein